MADIRLIKEDTDLSILRPLKWDAVLNGREYKVFDAPGFVHTIGDRWGENSYWACPRDEAPTHSNLVEFNGYAPAWGIKIEEINCYKCKWDEPEMRQGLIAVITRNGEDFYPVMASNIAYAYAEAYRLLCTKIQEGVINFADYHYWESDIEGHHILYMGRPYTLFQYMKGQCCAMAAPGHVALKDIYDDPKYGCNGELKLDLLHDEHINWYPDSKDNELS
ncbi:MAG: hypothetical protein NC311_06535 [Muribaculaceae bacterium]|nr:hypothetical protein [Muribaculaceae bacterium]